MSSDDMMLHNIISNLRMDNNKLLSERENLELKIHKMNKERESLKQFETKYEHLYEKYTLIQEKLYDSEINQNQQFKEKDDQIKNLMKQIDEKSIEIYYLKNNRNEDSRYPKLINDKNNNKQYYSSKIHADNYKSYSSNYQKGVKFNLDNEINSSDKLSESYNNEKSKYSSKLSHCKISHNDEDVDNDRIDDLIAQNSIIKDELKKLSLENEELKEQIGIQFEQMNNEIDQKNQILARYSSEIKNLHKSIKVKNERIDELESNLKTKINDYINIVEKYPKGNRYYENRQKIEDIYFNKFNYSNSPEKLNEYSNLSTNNLNNNDKFEKNEIVKDHTKISRFQSYFKRSKQKYNSFYDYTNELKTSYYNLNNTFYDYFNVSKRKLKYEYSNQFKKIKSLNISKQDFDSKLKENIEIKIMNEKLKYQVSLMKNENCDQRSDILNLMKEINSLEQFKDSVKDDVNSMIKSKTGEILSSEKKTGILKKYKNYTENYDSSCSYNFSRKLDDHEEILLQYLPSDLKLSYSYMIDNK